MRKIALVGTASSSAAAPYDDPSWEIWGVSSRSACVTRANRWFELHRLDGEPQDWAKLWREAVKGFIGDTELVMMYPEPDLAKNIMHYPYGRITDRFGTYFMTSTFSWMMALAIDELRPNGGVPIDGELAIYGVDMEYGTEYKQQRVGFRHFIDLAKFLNIPVVRLADSGMAYEPVAYPMWQDDPLMAKNAMRSKEVKRKLELFRETIQTTRMMISQCNAVIPLLEEFKAEEKLAIEKKKLKALMQTSADLSRDIVGLEAIDSEQTWLSDYLQP